VSKKLLIALGCLAIALIVVPSAQAAYPGANGRVVFVNSTGIASANPDGTDFKQLTTVGGNVSDQNPAWSADGTKIVFDRNDGSSEFNDQVWTMNADGSGAAPVPRSEPASDFGPYFFPDGRIVFAREGISDPDPEIWVMNADGSGQSQLTDNDTADFDPTVSPDGKSIAFARVVGDAELAIYRMDPNGANVSLLATDHTGDPQICDFSPNYSPDGSTVVFARSQGAQVCTPVRNLYTVPAGVGAGVPLTNSTDFDTVFAAPAYSPDGSQIVFANEPSPVAKEPAAAADPRVAPTSGQLGFIPAAGGEPQAYLDGDTPDWQPIAKDLGTCFGQKVTIAATNGADKIVGTPGNDVIRGFRGKDQINGKGGDDVLCGGRGKDKLLGKGGDDILLGGAQSDFLNGGKGSNRLFGGTPGANPETAKNVCVDGAHDKLKNCQVVK
jgi:hypothetical protein